MPVDVTTEIMIRAPREQVWRFAVEPENAPRWYANIRVARLVTPPPVRVGTLARFEASFLGRTLAYTYEVAELVEGERFVMRTSEGPFPMETTYTFEDAGGGTRMTLRNRGEPSGFSRLFAPWMARAMRRANEADLALLRTRMESPQA